MAVILFRLNDVPEDEADEVRALLAENNISFYETSGGNWGISVAALWLSDDDQLSDARSLLSHYQAERSVRIRAEYEQQRQQGKAKTLLCRIKDSPVRTIFFLSIVLIVIWLSVSPFFTFFE